MPLSYLKNTIEQKQEFTESLMFFLAKFPLLFWHLSFVYKSWGDNREQGFPNRLTVWEQGEHFEQNSQKLHENYKINIYSLGQNGRGNMWGQANLLSSRGTHPIPPHKGSPGECMHVGVCVLERRGWGWRGVNQCHKVDFWVHVIFSGQFCQGGWLCLEAKTSLSKYMNHEPSLTKNDW